MKLAFAMPTSPLIRVEYMVGNVKYATTIPNPKSNDSLAIEMLKKKVGMSQIKDVLPLMLNVPQK